MVTIIETSTRTTVSYSHDGITTIFVSNGEKSPSISIFKPNNHKGKKANENYENNFTKHFRSEVKEKYRSEDDVCNDSVFFIPIIDKIFDLTRVI